MSLFAELRRRNVFRVAIAYLLIAWLILQIGGVLQPALLLPEWVNTLLAFFLILGFPLALFFAWAFELTPEGLKREKEVARDRSVTHVTGRKMDFAIIALLAIAVVYFVADKFWLQSRSSTSEQTTVQEEAGEVAPSIAVLPLADMSPKGDSAYFSDGLTEELLNILSKISELRVAGRTSSFAFKGQNEDLREIGRKLDVDHILEGSVRKDDARNRVRITLQLIDTNDGFHRWSETYDRDLDDIFAIQEEVAHEVAKVLRIKLLGEDVARLDRVASTDLGAYDLYLQGLQELRKAGFVNLERAVDLFQQVLAMDSGYTPARLGLARTWHQMADTGAISTRAALDRGLPMLEPILVAEPDNADAHALHALYLDAGDRHAEAEVAFTRTLELAPRHAQALADFGRYLYDRRQVDRGMALIDEAVRIEPYDPSILFDQCQTNAHLGRIEQSLAACGRMRELAPDGPQAYYGEALAHMYVGDVVGTLQGFVEAIRRDPEDYEMLGGMTYFWLALGEAGQARIWLERAEALGAGQPVPLHARVLLHEFLEQYERAGDLAAQAIAQGLEDRHGTNFMFRRANAAQATRTGDWERGLAPYRELYPWAFAETLVVPGDAADVIDDLLLVARLMKSANPLAQRPEELLAVVEAHVGEYHPALGRDVVPYRRAALGAMRGDADTAVAQLREARDLGLLSYWRPLIVDDPVFMPLASDPGFRAFIGEYEQIAEAQRERALALLEVSP